MAAMGGIRWIEAGAVAATTVAAICATVVPSSASPARQVVPVNAQFHDDGITAPATMTCETIDGVVGVALEGHAAVTGGWQGDAVYTACFYIGLPKLPVGIEYFYGTETFTGSVDGCGNGTMTYRLTDGYVSPDVDTATGRRSGQQKWRISPDGGSGDLTNVRSGSGAAQFIISATGENDGTFTGELRC
ncbi:hypothetical protein [Nocardia sputorum]|uniref:hypothetical protein n=1 Tax=Nocardia sputorum TaxID=2984338 RepID=UPI0024921522|nr:hypothetical protein [Nocardia sputorum]